MIPFAHQNDGNYTVTFERHEATLLSDLAGQIAELLRPLSPVVASDLEPYNSLASLDADGSRTLHADPAIARLLPDAYAYDGAGAGGGAGASAGAASDFRRYTERGLAGRKVANALVVVRSLAASISDQSADHQSADDQPRTVTLTEAQTQSWLRNLTDIRLTLAARIGIETDADAASDYDDGSPYNDGDSETDGDQPETDETASFLRDIYHWLGFVSESLIAAIDR